METNLRLPDDLSIDVLEPGDATKHALAAFVELHNRIRPRTTTSSRAVEHWMRTARDGVQLHAVVRDGAGLAAALVRCSTPLWIESPGFADAMIVVAPEWQRQGIGTFLYGVASGFAHDLDMSELVVPVDARDSRSISWWEKRSFSRADEVQLLELDQSGQEVPRHELPEGLTVHSLGGHRELLRDAYVVEQETIADLPAPAALRTLDYDDWIDVVVDSPTTQLDAWYLVRSEQLSPVAVCELEVYPSRPRVAWIRYTAVHPAWRGRGIARAVKSHALADVRTRLGITTAISENNTRNEAMLHINEQLGFQRAGSRLHLRGPLQATR